jgi:uncharacterized membrane protein YsdA (DUF1294 family)
VVALLSQRAAPERKWITRLGLSAWVLILAVWNVAGWAIYWWDEKAALPVLGEVPLIAILFMAGAATGEIVGANLAIEVERAHHDRDKGRMWTNIFCAAVFAIFNAYGSHNAFEQFLVRPKAEQAETVRAASLTASSERLGAIDKRIAAVPICEPALLGPKALLECGANRRQEIADLEATRLAEQKRHDAIPEEATELMPLWAFLLSLLLFSSNEAVKMLGFWSIGAGRVRTRIPDTPSEPALGGTEGRTVVPLPVPKAGRTFAAIALTFLAGMIGTRGTPDVPKIPTEPGHRDTVEQITGHELDAGLTNDDKLADIRILRDRRVPWREVEKITGVPKSTAWAALKRANARAALSDRVAKRLTPLESAA